MKRSARVVLFSSSILSLAGVFALAGCGGEEKPPIFTGGGNNMNNNRDGGGGNDDRDAGPGGGQSGMGGGGSSGTGGSGGTGGSSGSGDAGSGAGSCTPGEIGELPSSPANPWIAYFEIDSSGFAQLKFVKADGTGGHEYSGDSLSETDAAWSPDGTKLAVTAVGSGSELRILDFEGGTDELLNTGLNNMSRPRWSPDGSEIVVAGRRNSGDPIALFRVDVESAEAEALTMPAEGDGGHDFAPSGALYFVRNVGGGLFDIFMMPQLGCEEERVTTSMECMQSLAASPPSTNGCILGGVEVHPDGSKLLFARGTGSGASMTTQLVEHTLDGGAERVIGDAGDEEPDYFGGGDKLVVNRDSFDGDSEIAVADPDGGLMTRVTDAPQFKTNPAVGPVESDDVDVTQF